MIALHNGLLLQMTPLILLQAKTIHAKFRVNDLENLLKLADEGVTIVGEMETYDYGKFGWIWIQRNKMNFGNPLTNYFYKFQLTNHKKWKPQKQNIGINQTMKFRYLK
jgi:hypothetical protein